MLAARCHQLSTDCIFGRRGLKGAVHLSFSETDTLNLNTVNMRRAIMGDAFEDDGHFRPLPLFWRNSDRATDISAPPDAPDLYPNFSLIDQLLSCVNSQGFAASGDWYQNSSLTIKTDEDTTGHH